MELDSGLHYRELGSASPMVVDVGGGVEQRRSGDVVGVGAVVVGACCGGLKVEKEMTSKFVTEKIDY